MREQFMREALAEAKKAFDMEEIPIGAVVVCDGRIIARGHNLREHAKDPTAHAEIVAMRRAAEYLGGWRLHRCDLYVTVEPCPMCAGAIVQARIRDLVFGAKDERAGCCGSVFDIVRESRFNHQVNVTSDVLAEECRQLMRDFFQKKR